MAIGTIALLGLATISAASSFAAGRQAKREAKVQRQIAEQQGAQARKAAEQVAVETAERVKESRRLTARLKSTQTVRFLKSGVQLEGTVLKVLDETETLGEQDVQALIRSGQAEADEFISQQFQSRLQGRSATLRGRAAFLSGIGGATGSLASAFAIGSSGFGGSKTGGGDVIIPGRGTRTIGIQRATRQFA